MHQQQNIENKAMVLTKATFKHSQRRSQILPTETGKHSGALHIFFYLGLALLACHELDAVARHEWRLIPGLNRLDDESGLAVFVLLHLPIFVVLFWLCGHRSNVIRFRSQLIIDAFLIGHALVHFALAGHPQYEFLSAFSQICIYGGAAVGLTHAVLAFQTATPD